MRHAQQNQEAVRGNKRASAVKTRLLPSMSVAAGLGIDVYGPHGSSQAQVGHNLSDIDIGASAFYS